MKIKGIVTKTSQKEGRFGIEVGPMNWYNGFGELPCKSGDTVEIEYEENPGKDGRTFKNIQNVNVLESTPVAPSGQEIGLKRKLATECVLKAVDVLSRKDLEAKPSTIKILANEYYNTAMEIADENL